MRGQGSGVRGQVQLRLVRLRSLTATVVLRARLDRSYEPLLARAWTLVARMGAIILPLNGRIACTDRLKTDILDRIISI
jgi:hypothetical protein